MHKPLLHFAHANGFPSKVYSYLFEQLSADFDIAFVPALGIDPAYQVDNHWQSLTQQVIDSVQRALAERGQTTAIGIGHSLGSLCTLQAAYRMPELFSQVICLDPPLLTGRYAMLVHWAKLNSPKLLDQLTPAGMTSRRRDVWASRQAAAASLRSKPLYRDFDERCFADFIRYGLSDTPDGQVTLTIPKAVELAVYRNNPSLYWLKPNQPPAVPAYLMVGQDSVFYQRGAARDLKAKQGIDYTVREGGHMFPLEHPDATVQAIKDRIAAVQAHQQQS